MKQFAINSTSTLMSILVVLGMASAAFAEEDTVVKMSNSGICHTPYSQYYSRTGVFTPYDSVEECIAAGGRLPQ